MTTPNSYNAAADLLQRNLQGDRSNKIAYIDDHGSYTYGELADRAGRFANGLKRLGIAQEQRILLALHDGIDFPSAFLGAIQAGVVPVCVNTLLTTQDYNYMLQDSRSRVLVVSEALLLWFRRDEPDAGGRSVTSRLVWSATPALVLVGMSIWCAQALVQTRAQVPAGVVAVAEP